jgi:hypothetical protein
MLFQGTTASEYQCHEPFAEPSHHNEIFSLGDTCVHGDQNTACTDYFRGEGIPPLGHQQPSTSVVPYWQENPGLMVSSHGTNGWDKGELLMNPTDWSLNGEQSISTKHDRMQNGADMIDDSPFVHLLRGSGQVNNHSHTQAHMSINGGRTLEVSTSVQHNLLMQQSFPAQFQDMPGMHYTQNLPNPDVPNPDAEPWHHDCIHEPEPSAYQFPGADFGNF